MAAGTLVRTRIAAPDAKSAMVLRRRLRDLHAVTVSRGAHWEVALDGEEGHLDEVLPVVRDWLRDLDRISTSIVVGDKRRTVLAWPEEQWLGAGYDDAALEHEP